MSQSRPGGFDHHDELDPLLGFSAEPGSAESPRKPVDPALPAAAAKADDALPLRLRLDQAERSLDRARSELAALKSNHATLVTAVDEIKKRLSRRPDLIAPPAVRVPPQRGLVKTMAVVIVCLAVGAAVWSFAALGTMIEVPAPPSSARASALVETTADKSVGQPPVESQSSLAPTDPAPAAVVATPPVALQTVATVPPPPLRQRAEREPRRQGAYLGTLSIDAAPAGEVFIDRQLAGRTPLRAENLRAGSHLIWIDREGYRRWTRVVAVAADRVTRVTADLDPLAR